jgi:hypothetical protein
MTNLIIVKNFNMSRGKNSNSYVIGAVAHSVTDGGRGERSGVDPIDKQVLVVLINLNISPRVTIVCQGFTPDHPKKVGRRGLGGLKTPPSKDK